MKLWGRERESKQLEEWASHGGFPIVVWGAAGVGKSALVGEVLPDWPRIDARGLDRLPDDDQVIWDGVAVAVAREALRARPRRVVITTRSPLRVEHERALELGPLAMDAAAAMLGHLLSKAGHDVSPPDLDAIASWNDGIPCVMEHAAGAFELLGVEGLTGSTSAGGPQAHLTSLFQRLDESWRELTPDDQAALGILAMVGGPIRPPLAAVLLGAGSLQTMRRLRDQSWMHVTSPGNIRILRPLRAFIRGVSPPPARCRARFSDWLFDQAMAADLQVVNDPAKTHIGAHVDDLLDAVEHRPEDPRVVRALRVLSSILGSPRLERCITEARQRHRDAPELLLAQSWVDYRSGRLEVAYRELSNLRRIAPTLDPSLIEGLCAQISVHLRKFDRARVHGLAVKEMADSTSNGAGVADAEGLMAMIHQSVGEHPEARRCYERALLPSCRLGLGTRESNMRANLAVVLASMGHPDLARDEFARALGVTGSCGVTTVDAVIRGNLGWLCVVQGMPAEGEHHLRHALSLILGHRHVRMRVWFLAQWAAAMAILGEVDMAVDAFEQTEQLLQTATLGRSAELVHLLRGFADIASGRRDQALARLNRARRATDEQPALVAIENDARTAAILLEARILATPGEVLYIGDSGEWIRVSGGEPLPLPRSTSLRSSLLAFAEARLERREALTVGELFAAGWPGEEPPYTTQRNRVQRVVHQLRSAGLQDILLHTGAGYCLDPGLPLLLGYDS